MDLREETEKMLKQIEPLIDKIEVNDKKGEEMLSNMKAYIEDSKHFLKNGDLIRSFEAAIWSFAILEICRELEIFEQK